MLLGNVTAAEIIAHWDFNSPANKIIPDSTGKYPAIISESSQIKMYVSPDDKALYFNGGGTSVQVKHADDLALENDFSIKCIIKPTMLKDFRTILFKGSRKVKPNLINYWFSFRDGKVGLSSKLADNTWNGSSSAQAVLKENEWAFLVISYKNGVVKLWVNGKECNMGKAAPVPGGKLIKNTYPLIIGEAQDEFGSGCYPFVGLIDDIKIIKGAVDSMSRSEIDEWNKRLADFEQREIAEKAQRIAARIDRFSSEFDVSENAVKNIKAKLSATKTDEGFAMIDRELNELLFKSYYNKYCSNYRLSQI
jgi:hypothetical protein